MRPTIASVFSNKTPRLFFEGPSFVAPSETVAAAAALPKPIRNYNFSNVTSPSSSSSAQAPPHPTITTHYDQLQTSTGWGSQIETIGLGPNTMDSEDDQELLPSTDPDKEFNDAMEKLAEKNANWMELAVALKSLRRLAMFHGETTIQIQMFEHIFPNSS